MTEYIPATQKDRQEMLKAIGCESVDSLFKDVPESIRLRSDLNLPAAISELELMQELSEMSSRNSSLDKNACFLGAGAYDHFIPAAIDALISRQEFCTSYTPYQPEISQGTLTAIFEYQTLISELSGLPISNASLYDGGHALSEAAFMAVSGTKRSRVLIANSVHPESRGVLKTMCRFRGVYVDEIGYKNGCVSFDDLNSKINGETAAVIVQNPNFFGQIERLSEIGEIAKKKGAYFVVSADPISLALLKSPGECGADIAVGEGQPLGNPLTFGGPYLGFIATTEKNLRKMPGRIVGQTKDAKGKRGFVLTIQSREQHIRREKATSNICSNQALNALAATIYLTLLGKEGLKKAATLSLQKAHYAKNQLLETGNFSDTFGDAPFFREFLLTAKKPVSEINAELLKNNIIGGLGVEKYYSELKNGWLLAFTEKCTKKAIDSLVKAFQ